MPQLPSLPGVQLTIKGDYLNLGTGTINNSDTIDLSGDFINNASNNCFGTSQERLF
ncbi:MAG: hypothetical protein IPG39_19055 [Bacteroidetes bacterium]|nr:hypothetical protein [Bacteroidota bacterium]